MDRYVTGSGEGIVKRRRLSVYTSRIILYSFCGQVCSHQNGVPGGKMASLTRNEIKSAFIALLEERPASKITVKDVVNKCGINRNTFYYYFQDLPALVEAAVIDSFQELMEKHLTLYTIQDCLGIICDEIREHRKALLHLYQASDRELFELSQWRICEHLAGQYIETVTKDRPILPGDKRTLQEFARSILFGLTMDGFREGLKQDIRDRYRTIIELYQGHTEELLDRCEKRSSEEE